MKIVDILETAYSGNPIAADVEKIYQDAFGKYKTPDDNMEVPNLKWKGVDITVWNIGIQGSQRRKDEAAFVSFRFDGDITKEDALEWTKKFAKRHDAPYTDINYKAGHGSWDDMYVRESSFTAILYED